MSAPTEVPHAGSPPAHAERPGWRTWLVVAAWLAGSAGLMWAYNPITPMDLAAVCRQVIKP